MLRVNQEVMKSWVNQLFYVEKKKISRVAIEIGCARNTVKKYIKILESENIEKPIKSSKEDIESISSGIVSLNYLEVAIHEVSDGNDKFKDFDIRAIADEYVKYLGIQNSTDQLKLEIAFENFITYLSYTKRIRLMNSISLDLNWAKSADKMVKIVKCYSEAAQKHLGIFQSIIKELEIKYNKRSPDISRVQNYNLQRNEFNMSHDSIKKPFDVHG